MTIDEAIIEEEQKKQDQAMTEDRALTVLQNGLLPQVHGAYYEALKMAIKDLQKEPYFWEKCPYYEPDIMFDGKEEYDWGKCTYKTEPSEDAISRAAVIKITEETGALETQGRVKDLPSVIPMQSNASNASNAQDCISKQAAIDALRDAENHAFNMYYKGLVHAHKIIAELPPIQPAQKVGRWIKRNYPDLGICMKEQKMCSVCGKMFCARYNPYWSYCGNCGAKMEEGE